MSRRLLLAGGFSLLLAVAPASGGTPFGGDDGGFVPPNPPVKRCEEGILRQTKALARCVIKCHVKGADQALRTGTFDDEPCEQTCLDKYTGKSARLAAAGGCPPCLDETGQGAIAASVLGFAEAVNGDVYCAPGTPFGGDDDGNIPPDRDTARCEARVEKNLGHLITCLRLVHMKAVRRAFRGGTFDDEALEQNCRAKYDQGQAMALAHGGCPACLDAATQADIGTQGEEFADGNLGAIYCASPSGAFLDEGA